ncbi:hypothetical protein ACJMK2_026792 [Sinanodonta woodiana]|uniref:DED domain-containing protein n=1 Tax=Sinanodonta woodiana TaxID=1069815 RepID=A0ABD3XL58_SINWO
MAAKRRPLKIGAENKHEGCLTLHEMLHIVGNQLDDHSFLSLKTILSLRHPYNANLGKMKNGFETEFLIEALEKTDQLDETNFDKLHLGLIMAGRSDLIHIASLRKPKTVQADPVNDFLETMGQSCCTVYGRIHTKTSVCEDSNSEGCINKENVKNNSEACNHSHYSKDRREKDHVPSNISKNLHSSDRCVLCDEQKQSVSNEPKPSTSYEERKLSLSANNSKCSMSNYKPKPCVSTDEPKPSTSYEEGKLSLSADNPKCSVSNYKPKPCVSTDEPKPSTSYEKRKLLLSANNPKCSVSNYKPKPCVSTDEPKPSTSYEERKLSLSADNPKPSTSYEERNFSSFYKNSRLANYNLDRLDLCDDCICKAMPYCDTSAGISGSGAERVSYRTERVPKFFIPDMKNVTPDCEMCGKNHALHNDLSYSPYSLCDANTECKMETSSPSQLNLHCNQKSNMTDLNNLKRKRKYRDEPIPSTSGCLCEPIPSTLKTPFDKSSSASECFERNSQVSNYDTHKYLLENKDCCCQCDYAYSRNFQGSPNLNCESCRELSDIGYQKEESSKLNGTYSCKCDCHCDKNSPSSDSYYSCHNLKIHEKSPSFANLDSISKSSQKKKFRGIRPGMQEIAGLKSDKKTVVHSCRQSVRLMKQTCMQEEMSSLRKCQTDQRQTETPSGDRKHEGSQRRHLLQSYDKEAQTDNSAKPSQPELKKKQTCDVRLRVRAEYADHNDALAGNIHSNKPELIDRRFEKFSQANTILKSRDLGAIICDIKFSELTYLDAFWRDYVNGSLLEALKAVFITDTLRQAVGQESIKLLVSVDEDDYEAGRVKLLQNLQD